MNTRISKRDLPRASDCPYLECVYNDTGWCDDVRVNKGNSDAYCFKKSNKDLLEMINRMKP